MIIQEIRDELNEQDVMAVIFDDPSFDRSILGLSTDGNIIYSLNSMIQELMEDDDISYEEALDFIEYNTIRTLPYIDAENRPVILDDCDAISMLCGGDM